MPSGNRDSEALGEKRGHTGHFLLGIVFSFQTNQVEGNGTGVAGGASSTRWGRGTGRETGPMSERTAL